MHTPSTIYNIMPKQCIPLGEISGNVKRRRELTPYERAQIIGAAKCGVNPSTISARLLHSRRTVRSTLSLESLRSNGKSQPRSGRPKKYSKYDERLLVCIVHQFPKFTYTQLRAFTGLKLCDNTIRTIL